MKYLYRYASNFLHKGSEKRVDGLQNDSHKKSVSGDSNQAFDKQYKSVSNPLQITQISRSKSTLAAGAKGKKQKIMIKLGGRETLPYGNISGQQ